MSPERHLLIIWEKARYEEPHILDDLSRHVRILRTYEVCWTDEHAPDNLSRFYGQNLPRNSHKAEHCGLGPAVAVIVEVTDPGYERRSTSKGPAVVNATMFDLKKRYREWTGGGHKIHATNDPREARHDVALLTGQPLDTIDPSPTPRIAERLGDLAGAGGWADLQTMFRVLDECVDHVVLRNVEPLVADGAASRAHPDIDLLVADRCLAVDAIGARPTRSVPWRVQYQATVAGQPALFDLRSIGDGYLPNAWQRTIIERRTTHAGISVPAPDDHLWALAYHAVVHKDTVADDYLARICDAAAEVEGTGPIDDVADLRRLVAARLVATGERAVPPDDLSVGFNVDGLPAARRPVRRVAWDALRRAYPALRPLVGRWRERV